MSRRSSVEAIASVAALGQQGYPMVCHGGVRRNAEIFAGVVIVHFEPTDVGVGVALKCWR